MRDLAPRRDLVPRVVPTLGKVTQPLRGWLMLAQKVFHELIGDVEAILPGTAVGIPDEGDASEDHEDDEQGEPEEQSHDGFPLP